MKSSALGCPTDPVPPPDPLDRLPEPLDRLEDRLLEPPEEDEREYDDPLERLPDFPEDSLPDAEDEPVEEPVVLLEEPEEVPLARSSP